MWNDVKEAILDGSFDNLDLKAQNCWQRQTKTKHIFYRPNWRVSHAN
ncbi:MAG: hypothetical protein PHE67_00250 [Campylobacterales bacterium]|nr:hypothetical protein [Campylobacterales bacterium]